MPSPLLLIREGELQILRDYSGYGDSLPEIIHHIYKNKIMFYQLLLNLQKVHLLQMNLNVAFY